MALGFERISIGKPAAYERLDKDATVQYFKADEEVLKTLKATIIDKGEEQLKSKTGYSKENPPEESPLECPEITLGGIKFNLVTHVQATNPEYAPAYNNIITILQCLLNDWKLRIDKPVVKIYGEEPFVDLDYLMWQVTWCTSSVTELGVVNTIRSIEAPREIEDMSIDTLVLSLELMHDFNIEQPGAAKVWYLAKRFYNDVLEHTVKPVKKEMEARSGVSKEKIPAQTQEYWEQVAQYVLELKSVPSPRAEYAQTINRLFKIPQKDKPEGSKELPVIVKQDNYKQLIEVYRPIIKTSLQRWKNLDGNIGELIVFFYGIEEDPRVQEEFPFLPAYQVQRDGNNIFISLSVVKSRLEALKADYKKNRLLRIHAVKPIVS